ncbi:MAG: hypothetical protein JNN04_00550 [Cyclobacteriaceae bacterium]|nr:hypothetical protein [Cyclobacteriaceae bacterium]
MRNWVDTEVTYPTAGEKGITIQSSLPKGGGTLLGPAGKTYSKVVFWFRVANQSGKPAAVSLNFPAQPLSIFPSRESHIRVMLHPDTMSAEKIQLLDYGLTNLESFVAANFDKPARLTKTVPANEDFYFYVPILFYQARGTTRVALVLKDQELFLRINIDPDIKALMVPCGNLVLRN